MVNETYHCPACELSEPVVRFGFTSVGNQRLRCQSCKKTWTPQARDRSLTVEKEACITAALQERSSQRAIARTFKVARTTHPLPKDRSEERTQDWRRSGAAPCWAACWRVLLLG